MAFNPAQNAANLAALQSKVATTPLIQGANFTLVQSSTTRVQGNSIYQMAMPILTSKPRTALSWSAVYRSKVMPGTLIVCNVGMEPLAEAMLLAEASDALNNMDLKIAAQGSPLALYPSTAPGY